ncbi:MAG: signal peptide peptidase SppA [Nitrospirae bacterium]|nr:signal peptide peptidase SppA [Nitrospirota bacterium]
MSQSAPCGVPNRGRRIREDTRGRARIGGLILVAVLIVAFAGGMILVGMRGGPKRWVARTGGKLARVDLEGIILESEPTTKWLKTYADREDIKGIILRIDSQGGAVGPSQEIYAMVKEVRTVKPVVASLGSVAASGGYYVASAATRIFSNPGTLTGNVGVIMGYTHVERLLNRIYVDPVIVKSGARKDVASPMRPPTEEDLALLQGLVDDVSRQFLADVRSQRELTEETVALISDGRPLSGAQAKDMGLVDDLGTLQDATAWLKAQAGIEGEPVIVRPPSPQPSLIEWLTSRPEQRFPASVLEQLFFFGPMLSVR